MMILLILAVVWLLVALWLRLLGASRQRTSPAPRRSP